MLAPQTPAASRWRIVLPFAAVTLIWGLTWYAIKLQLGLVPAPWSVTYRFALASLIMFAVCILMRRQLAFSPGAHVFFMALGLCQFAGNFNLVYLASGYLTSGLIAVVFALLVVPNAILARAFLGQPVSFRFVVGSLLGIAGVALLFRQELLALETGAAALTGIGATLAGVVFASIANVMQATKQARRLDLFGMLAWSMLYGALGDAGLALVLSGPPVAPPSLTYALSLAYLAAFGSAIAFVLYFDVIRSIGPARAAYSSVLIPFIAMAVSTLLEDYRWTGWAVAGALLTIAGLVIAIRARAVPAGVAAAGGTTGRS
jgi:drug/metabolite transporter (DMT)-like permease